MAVATGTATVATGALATSLVALWAYANGEDVSEEVKKLWNGLSKKMQDWLKRGGNPNSEPIEYDKNGEQVEYKDTPRVETGATDGEVYEEEISEEPPKNENPYPNIPVSPQGAIAGAITGINNSDNNFIKDTTNENIESNIGSSFNDYIAKMEEYQEKQWAREDSAYRRAVEDARLAGINIGALGGNIQPAQSSTNIMSSASSTQFQEIAEFIQQQIDNNFSGNQNDKDRLTSALQMMLMMALMKK